MYNRADMQSNRILYAAAAIFMQVLLGIIYSWSVFRGPLAQLHSWSRAETIAPYRYSILAFAASMIVAGFWQDRKGPRLVATVGGFLLGTGCLLAGFIGDTLNGLILAYGIIAGAGVGFAYVTPIAMCIKWFPDKRGMIVGLAVMGFGMGPLLFGPLLEKLIGKDPALFGQTIPTTFFILAAIFYVGVMGSAQFYRVPPAGWRPTGWTPPPSRAVAIEMPPGKMIRTWQFYLLWLVYFLGTSVGLVIIGEASPLLQEMAKRNAVMEAGVALGIMSIFNGAGRLAWGSVSDRFGRKIAVYGMCAASLTACLGFLRSASDFWMLLIGLCCGAFAYGGYLALMPSFTADYFGPKNVGANYGLLFSAWGVCGFIVPGYFAGILDAARKANDLAGGYGEVFLSLSVLAVIGLAITVFLSPPAADRIAS